MAEKIGRFETLSEISRGPLACVYKASDPESGQVVALKTVALAALGHQVTAWVQRILEEAESTKALNSHNLAPLYGAGDIGEQFCASMEYVQGNSIATMLSRQESFSIWDLQDITRQACQGLEHAHSHRAVHYSLEPAKIMVSWDGTVKVLGFGISQMGSGAAYASGPPPAVLHYMSPEQVRGEPLDARANIFTMGAILYEMVTDRKAFGGDDAEQVRQQILNGMPVPPDMVLSKILPGLSEVLMKALSKVPDQRYQSAQELVNALEQCKETSGKPASPRKAPEAVHGLNIPQAPRNLSGPELISAAESAASPTQQAAQVSPMMPEAARNAAPSRPKAAAAAASAGSAGLASISAMNPVSAIKASAAAEAEREAAMAPAKDARGAAQGRSFSDVTELPPLKEIYVAQPPPDSAEPEAAIGTLAQIAAPAEKLESSIREAARRALREIAKTPPKFFLYSIGAAVVIILLIVASIGHRIHSESSPDEAAAPPASVEAEPSAPQGAAPVSAISVPAAQTPAPAPAAPEAIQARSPEKPTVISVLPRRGRHKAGKLPAPQPAVVDGEIAVNSTPEGAQVQIDGKSDPAWVTPNHVTGIAPGRHTVGLSKAGYVSETRSIEVASGSKSFLVVQLAQAGATAFVSSVPPGAQVLVDGKDVGHTTPVQVPVQKPGPHIFVVRKSGYLEESVSANLQSGQTFQFAPVLRQLGRTDEIHYAGRFKKLFGGSGDDGMGTLTVKTDPKGAQILVNHKMLDRPSPAQFYLNPGAYVIDITLSGYKSVHRVITVDKDGKFSIDETLERQ
jgi:eukaryotic-like serine/threonine-protein kinase